MAPGDPVEFKVFIVGYGRSDGAKVGFYPPPDLVQDGRMVARYDLEEDAAGIATWGTTEQEIDEGGHTIDLTPSGLQAEGWRTGTLFFDASSHPVTVDSVPKIATESAIGNAPVSYHFTIARAIRPGSYDLQMTLTYHNGFAWSVSKATVALLVPSAYQRRQVLTWAAGLALAGIAVVPDWVELISR